MYIYVFEFVCVLQTYEGVNSLYTKICDKERKLDI